MKGRIGDYEKHRAQGTGLRAQRKKLRVQGSGRRGKDLEMKGPHDCKAARPHDCTTARQCIMYYRRCIIGDVLH
jgi:hypothetical protein